MKLDYLHDMTANGKYTDIVSENLVRLYDFDSQEAKLFQELIRQSIITQKQEVRLENEHFIDSLNCKLTLKIDSLNCES